jgi:O-antigen ligase
MGCGTALAVMGVLSSDTTMIALGAGSAWAALVVLLGAGWLDGIVLVALAVPLPAIYRSEALRIAAALPVTAALVSGWVLHRGLSADRLLLGRFPLRSFSALLVVFVIATLFAQSPVDSARELANFGLLLAFLVTAVDLFRREPERMERVADFLVATAAVCGVLAAFEMVAIIPGEFPRVGTPFNRAALGFGQPNGLGLFLALALPLAVRHVSSARGPTQLIGAAASACIGIGLVATFSRGAILAVPLGALALVATRDRGYVVKLWLVGFLALVVFDLATGGSLRDTIARSVDDWSIEQRFALTTVGVLTFLANPLLGVGPGGFAASLDEFGLLVPQLTDFQPTPHNAYVQVAAETGILGLLAFVAFLAGVLRIMMRSVRELPAAEPPSGDRSLRRAVLWAFAVLCVSCLLDWPFPHGTGQVAMILIAMGCASATVRR